MRRSVGPLLVLVLLACSPAGERTGGEAGEAGPLLRDPGFEEGGEAWAYIDDYRLDLYEVTDREAHRGQHSGWLTLDSATVPLAMPVRGATAAQDVEVARFPERLRGHFRVGRWLRPDDGMGLTVRVVVYALGDPRTRELVTSDGPGGAAPPPRVDSYGVGYRLAGRAAASDSRSNEGRGWANLDFVAAGPAEPPLDRWVPFDLPIRRDFEQVWGVVPENYEKLRVLLQVIWLDRAIGSEVAADVYFDDLELLAAPGG